MRRLLPGFVLMSLGGCWCYDDAFQNYCNETHKCPDGGGSGGPGGGPAVGGGNAGVGGGVGVGGGGGSSGGGMGTGGGNVIPGLHLEFAQIVDFDAPGCHAANVLFKDGNQAPTPPGVQGNLTLTGSPGVTFKAGGCGGVAMANINNPGTDSVMPIGIDVAHFGPTDIHAAFPGATGIDARFMATALLQFVKPAYHVTGQLNCSVNDAVEIRAYSLSSANTVSTSGASNLITLSATNDDVMFGTGAAMCNTAATDAGYQVVMPSAGITSLLAEATGLAGPGQHVTVTATASPDSGLTGTAMVDIYATCFPANLACDNTVDCCQTLYCDGGFCIP